MARLRHARSILWLVPLLLGPASLRGGEPDAPSAADLSFFESRVRPVLVSRCQSCHGAEKQKGGLRLDAGAAALKGGDSGPSIVPGKPEESLLIQALDHREEPKMPPKGKLPAGEIAALRRWVAMGAPWPDVRATRPPAPKAASAPSGFRPEERSFWAFQPPSAPPVPAVKRTDWVRTPIDAFLLSKLEARQLSPASPADKRTLIRRLSYDLTGLPPTPEETAAFLADRRPDAYERLVDRLLASPHYGERWGRHWLDVARYADSNGMDENLAFAHAWRYRDYVVDAFNRDLPFDAFVQEQLAGDLLPPSGDPDHDRRRLAATGFLVLGPKMLAEDDPMKMEMDIIDEQVDEVGKAFMGMTLGCARCHDHKFDPIRMSDYYGLAGIFKSTRTMEHYRVVAHWSERPLATAVEQAAIEQAQSRIGQKKAEIDAAVKQANAALLKTLTQPGTAAPPKLPEKPETQYSAEMTKRLATLRSELSRLEAEAPKLPPAMAVAERKAADLAIHLRGNHLTLGAVVPRRFPAILGGERDGSIGGDRSGRKDLAEWLTRPEHPLTARVIVNRVWQWHFGEGLVRSVDNFGTLGERPSHPELLDWLASRLVADGWSLKALHRRIVLSSAYRMSTANDPAAAAVDPENRLLWHFNRRRLDAEEIRDTILMASGQLDRSMNGSLLKSGNREYVAGTASVNNTNYQSTRRSLYLPVIRSALFEVFQAFDFPDPSAGSGRRDPTTVAPQALCLMNSDLLRQAAESLADAILRPETLDDAARLKRAYERTLGREPSEPEAARALAFLDGYERAQGDATARAERRRASWEALGRVLLGTSELIFVD